MKRAGTMWMVLLVALAAGCEQGRGESDMLEVGDETVVIDGREYRSFDRELEMERGPLARYVREHVRDDGGIERWAELPPIEEMTEEELAHALRPVRLFEGRSLIASEPSWEAAAIARGRIASESNPGFNPSGGTTDLPPENLPPETEVEESPAGQDPVTPRPFEWFTRTGCCGNDDRQPIRNNTSWPWATVVASAHPTDHTNLNWGSETRAAPVLPSHNITNRECTWQLVGASTALASAHCFYWNEEGHWIPIDQLRWGAAPDGQDNPLRPIPAGYPTDDEPMGFSYWTYPSDDTDPVSNYRQDSFTPSVPYGWVLVADGGNVEWDFAVVDFRFGELYPRPGDRAGWMGWGVYNDSQLSGSMYIHAGIPKVNMWDFPIADDRWPQIMWSFTHETSLGSHWIDYAGDCSGGDSGSGLWSWIDGGWRLVGITHGYHSTACAARRFDSTYYGFLRDTSEY